ncbi:MAG: exopolyphosphatase/guanosine-5'-triphosphate,3'-diphosphate pyrophosphatase [Verrucomicrobiales bacterium]|jgi:exopolyphosphatase/guanosine-5'-triphosphate,3'-diphosphate pyrophosphatase
MTNPMYAGIDCGTNSTRLIIGDGTTTFEREMTITGLGRGVDATGRLSNDGIERVRGALQRYRAIMDRYELAGVRMTATSAARDASNRDLFFDVSEQTVGVRPELISGVEEAELSFLGATAELDPADGPFLVFDIGGGSTEFAIGSARMEGGFSTDMGSVRFSEKYIESDPPLPEELLACLSVAEAHIDDVVREVPMVLSARQLVGLAGTVSTAAAVEIGLAEYDREQVHHFRLTREAIEDVYRTLVTEARADRIHNPGLEEGRLDTIVGGMCILARIVRYFDAQDVLVSESDILDGLILSQMP